MSLFGEIQPPAPAPSTKQPAEPHSVLYRAIPLLAGPCARADCHNALSGIDPSSVPVADWPKASYPLECKSCGIHICRTCENRRWKKDGQSGALPAALYQHVAQLCAEDIEDLVWICDNCRPEDETPATFTKQVLDAGIVTLEDIAKIHRHVTPEAIYATDLRTDGFLIPYDPEHAKLLKEYLRANAERVDPLEPDADDGESETEDDKDDAIVPSDDEGSPNPYESLGIRLPKRKSPKESRKPVHRVAISNNPPVYHAHSSYQSSYGNTSALRPPKPREEESEEDKMGRLLGEAIGLSLRPIAEEMKRLGSGNEAPRNGFNANHLLGRAPTQKMRRFEGSITEFSPWWDEFVRRVDQATDASLQDKIDTLRGLLHGQAADLVSHLRFGAADPGLRQAAYDDAKRILAVTYGDPRIQSREIWRQFQDLGQVPPGDFESLQDLLIQLRNFGNRLAQTGEPKAVLDGVVGRAYDLLPRDVAAKMTEQRLRNPAVLPTDRETFAEFLASLEREIHIARITGLHHGGPISSSNSLASPGQPAPKGRLGGNFIHRQSPPAAKYTKKIHPSQPSERPKYPCTFCDEQHSTFLCPWDLKQRQNARAKKHLCPNCLRPNHAKAVLCRYYDKKCRHCDIRHHPALCPVEYKRTKERVAENQGSKSATRASSKANPAKEDLESDCEEETPEPVSRSSNAVNAASGKNRAPKVFLCSFEADIVGPDGRRHRVGVYGDPGGSFSKIDLDISRSAGLPVKYRTRLDEGRAGTRERFLESTDRVGFHIIGRDGHRYHMEAFAVKEPAGDVTWEPQTLPADVLEKIGDRSDVLNLPPAEAKDLKTHLIIGQDFYHQVFKRPRPLAPGLVIYSSVFGRVLSGCPHKLPLQPVARGSALAAPTNASVDLDEEGTAAVLSINLFNASKPSPEDEGRDEDAKEACDLLRQLRETDEMGTRAGEESGPTEDPIWKKFKADMIRLPNGAYEVKLPLKDPLDSLQISSGFGTARNRLSVLLRSWPETQKNTLASLFKDFESRGIIEPAPPGPSKFPIYYIPFFVVAKESSHTTKLRPVLDAACRSAGSQALNDFIWSGPNLLPDLSGIIWRFRIANHVVLADISKAFYTVSVAPEHRDLQRILLPKSFSQTEADQFKIFRFTKLVMGITSSPFGLAAVARAHFENLKAAADRPNSVSEELLHQILLNLYVDNIYVPVSHPTKLEQTVTGVKEIFESAGMPLAEWSSDLDDIRKLVPAEKMNPSDDVSVLGMGWDRVADTTHLRAPNLEKLLARPFTKKVAAGLIASVFDIDGRLAPVLLRPRLLFHGTAAIKDIPWGTRLSEEIRAPWEPLIEDLKRHAEVKLPRRLVPDSGRQARLVGFADASRTAYGCVIYITQEQPDGTVSIKFLAAKSRVAPTGKGELTIPRLELEALVLLSKIATNVEKQLSELSLLPTILFTDSQCACHWCTSGKNLKPWHAARVFKIRGNGHRDVRYVTTAINPADHASRGLSMDDFLKSNFISGPEFLLKPFKDWPNFSAPTCPEEILQGDNPVFKGKKVKAQACANPVKTSEEPEPCLLDLRPENYNSLSRLLNVTAFCCRLAERRKGKTFTELAISPEERESALLRWVRVLQNKYAAEEMTAFKMNKLTQRCRQLDLFMDEKGILRIGSRLQRRPGYKSPIFLPKEAAHFVRLIIRDAHHRKLCAGAKSLAVHIAATFWIPGLHFRIKRLTKSPGFCARCSLVSGKPLRQPAMAPLPLDRITISAPFNAVGVDYFGPVTAIDPKTRDVRKYHVALFTCPATRAIHLELVHSQSVESCYMAITRFLARRGQGSSGWTSDNGKYFVAARDCMKAMFGTHDESRTTKAFEDLLSFLSDYGFEWQTYPERAPFWGGFIERLVALVKFHLRRVLWRVALNAEELQTVLCDIENLVNSRPLGSPSSDAKDAPPIRPIDFLHPFRHSGLPLPTDLELGRLDEKGQAGARLAASLSLRRSLLLAFCKRWETEYLNELRTRFNSEHKNRRGAIPWAPRPGRYYLLIEDNKPRGAWSFVRVSRLLTGPDDVTRFCEVQLPSGRHSRRAVSRLIPFEADQEDELHGDQDDKDSHLLSDHDEETELKTEPTPPDNEDEKLSPRAARAARRDALRNAH